MLGSTIIKIVLSFGSVQYNTVQYNTIRYNAIQYKFSYNYCVLRKAT